MDIQNNGENEKETSTPKPVPSTSKNEDLDIAIVEGSTTPSPPAANGRLTKRQWILLLIMGAIDLLSSMTLSVQAPFYPIEAEQKGATALEFGLVFGIFEFISFLTCPLFGKYMNKIGPQFLLNMSTLLNSVAVICFGLLEWVDDRTWFITLSFICRIVEGLGCAGVITTTFVVIAIEFPQSVATTFASLETVIGIGFILGPTVGAALYSVGGFPLPFLVLGGCFLVIGAMALFVMPKLDKVVNEDGTEKKGFGVWKVLKIPAVALAALSIASTSFSLGFISALLEPHIRQFDLSPLQIGLVFMVNGGMYAITAPFWGYLCDKIRRPVYFTILGNFFIFSSYLLIGPADFIPFDTTLWLVIVGLTIQGLGFGCCFISTFIVGLQDCINHGLPDNLQTYAVVAGLFQSMISLGAWLGPSVGGFLYDSVGFRTGSWVGLAISFIAGVSVAIHTCQTGSSVTPTNSKDEEERQPLLGSAGRQVDSERELVKSGVEPSMRSSSYGSTS